MKAPDFTLPDENGVPRSLSDYRGSWVVVYFYPKDFTSGCTTEACGFRDSNRALKNMGITVLGISKDSVATHGKFSVKYGLNFPLLSDEKKTVLKDYKAWGKKKFMGREFEGTFRKTFLIDPQGNIRKVYETVIPAGHARKVLGDIRTLAAGK
jgi:peroxiredoxin Q/BCP